MARIIKMQSRATAARVSAQPLGAGDGVEATITQALYMVRLYTEILAMDETIIRRIRQLVAKQSIDGDHGASLDNMRLILAQLEKIGQRIAYWNARLRSLLKRQLLTTTSGAAPKV